MKKLISIMLVMLFAPSLFSAVYEDFEYEINQNKEITIVKFLSTKQQAIIPSSINGNPVKIIGEKSFDGCKSLISIIIPDSVTTIGKKAFSYCNSLTSMTIPNSVTTIGDAAFGGCRSLTTILLADDNENFEVINNILYNKKEKSLLWCFSKDSSVIIPDGIHKIENYAFWLNSSLTSITIPNSVTTIGDGAFSWCESLTNITIPDSVTAIGNAAFYGSRSLTSISITNTNENFEVINNCLYNKKEKSLLHCFSNDSSVIIPNGIRKIGCFAFGVCYSLIRIVIPDSVTTIEECAFYGCWSLKSITIPNSVTTIGNGAFFWCNSLTVQCNSGSYAEKYCQENEIKYLTIPDLPQ